MSSDTPQAPLIETAYVYNFRSLREVEVHFTPLTILVGPNASGKTAFLETFTYKEKYDIQDHWRKELSKTPLSIFAMKELRLIINPNSRHLSFSTEQLKLIKPRHIYEFAALKEKQEKRLSLNYQVTLGDIVDYIDVILRRETGRDEAFILDLNQIKLSGLSLLPDMTRLSNAPVAASFLHSNGSNLTNLIDSMSRRKQGELSESLCKYIPSLGDVDVTSIDGGKRQLRFYDRWNPDVTYTPEQVSDGTMLMLAFLALQFQPEPPDLITIEEPERGLHPYLLREVVGMLRDLAEGRLGPKPIQVIVATHSAQLLDYAKPEEVRFFSRDPYEGDTRVFQIDTSAPDWEKRFELYRESLGEAWLAGALGGVPRKAAPKELVERAEREREAYASKSGDV